MDELLLSYPLAALRRGTWLFASGWPEWLLGAAVLAAAVLCTVAIARESALSLGRRAAIVVLQVATIAWLLALIWRPAVAIETLVPGRNTVNVLVDTSRSMSLRDGERTRLAQAITALDAGPLAALRERFTVHLRAFADQTTEIATLAELPAPGEHTNLAGAIDAALRSASQEPLAAVVVVSDGAAQLPRGRAALLANVAAAGIPIHTVGVGREVMPEDLELADVRLPSTVLPDSTVAAQVVIRHAGVEGTTRVSVRDGDAVIASRDVTLDPRRPRQSEWVEIPIGAAGVRDLEIRLEPLPDERILANNRARRVVDASERPLRVAYVEGQPRWEYKFIQRALAGDPSIELRTALRTTDNKRYRQGLHAADELADGLPSDRAALFAYDAVILGGVAAADLSVEAQELLAAFVSERGGGLLMLAGNASLGAGGWSRTPLAPVLPADLAAAGGPGAESAAELRRTEVRATLTPAGISSTITRLDPDPARSQQLWDALPPLDTYQDPGAPRPGAVTLIEARASGTSRPLLLMQRYGRGRAAILASASTWRWQMRLPHEDTSHETLWRQLVRELAGSAPGLVTLSAELAVDADDRASGASVATSTDATGVALRLEVRSQTHSPLDDAELRVTVSRDGAAAEELAIRRSSEAPGLFEAELETSADSLLRIDASASRDGAEIGTASLYLRGSESQGEDFAAEQNRALLEAVAQQSGGRYWTLDTLAELPGALDLAEVGIRRREVLELWSAPLALIVLLVLKSAEWLLRRRWGRL
jgi:uncharacterized membrane protein